MASTADGEKLTQEHQAAQVAIAVAVSAEARLLWGRLDIDDLDRSTPYWLAGNLRAIRQRNTQSQRLADAYMSEYRAAEIGQPLKLGAREAAAGVAALSLQSAGPIRVKQLIAGGMDPDEALAAARTKFEGVAARQALMGGRLAIARGAQSDRRAIGWRRVTDGNPCAFCALLAGRGPVYKSRNASVVRGDSLRYHGHCGCTAEVVYGTWEPTEAEQQFVTDYEKAAAQVVAEDGRTDLKRISALMRRNGTYRDSLASRAIR